MKKTVSLLLAAMLLLLCGCSDTEPFTCLELTMDVPKDIADVSEAEENIGFHFALESDTLFICGIRQDIIDIPNGNTLSLHDYAHQLEETYQLQDATHAQREGKDYIYFRFQVPLQDGVHQYLCGVYRSESAFWLLQMDAKNADFDEEACFDYLDSVKFK